MTHTTTSLTLAAIALAGSVFGAAPAAAERWHYLIDDRLAEHQRLLSDGVRNGSITRSEYFALDRDLRIVKRAALKARRDGHLSHAERDRIRMLQDGFAARLFAERNDGERRW